MEKMSYYNAYWRQKLTRHLSNCYEIDVWVECNGC